MAGFSRFGSAVFGVLSGTGLDASRSAMDNRSARDGGSSTMWVSKPIYESMPYFYLLAGAISLGASMYINHWYWPTICFVVGLGCLVAGLVVLLKRRDYRDTDRRTGH
jgi:hypothetical protein